jgi:hypothetical protein
MARRFFCPGCWMEIGEKADRCPHCGYALKDFQGLSYDYVRKLGTDRAVCIGNGRNDRLMVGKAAVGIAIIGEEGASAETVRNADVVCRSAREALSLLVNSRRLVATLRS